MQRSRTLLAMALAAVVSTPGCYSVRYQIEDSPTPVELSHGSGRFRYHFKEEGRHYFLVYGLVPIVQDKTETVLARHMVRGSRISNLKVTHQMSIWDYLISAGVNVLITLGLTSAFGPMAVYVAGPLGLGTRSVTYEGDVIDDTEIGE